MPLNIPNRPTSRPTRHERLAGMHSIPEPEAAAVSLMQLGAVDQANLSSSEPPSAGRSSPLREFDFLAAASKWGPMEAAATGHNACCGITTMVRIGPAVANRLRPRGTQFGFPSPQVSAAWQFTGRSDKLPYDDGGGDRDLPDFVVVLPPSLPLGSLQSGGICNFTSSAADRAPLRAMIRTHRWLSRRARRDLNYGGSRKERGAISVGRSNGSIVFHPGEMGLICTFNPCLA